eukprot:3330777-Prymnesium_polylepis.1
MKLEGIAIAHRIRAAQTASRRAHVARPPLRAARAGRYRLSLSPPPYRRLSARTRCRILLCPGPLAGP